ncbi:MAG: GDP-mannose 4,6-dehydratase, partial [Planctomycetota bacterium]
MSFGGRKVLVTGSDGFIGSHLVERLVELGADTRAFCFYNSNGSLGWLDRADESVRSKLDVRLGDVRDARFVERACEGIDTVFHLAALIAIPYSYEAPESFVDTNVKGTLNVLEGAKRADCRRVIHTSTSEVYGTPDSVPIDEKHELKGQSPYSASKIGADKMCEAYHGSYDLPVTVLRPFNTYGPRQSMRAVLPTIINQLLSGAAQVKLGSLDPKRDLTYVADTVEGFVLAADAEGIEGEVVQLGTGRAVSIGELFETSCKVLGREAKVVQEEKRVRPAGSEVMHLLSDPARARAKLGWEAETSLEKGI